jgi:hypothetical protein
VTTRSEDGPDPAGEPGEPVEPVEPVDPVEPVEPVGPVGPVPSTLLEAGSGPADDAVQSLLAANVAPVLKHQLRPEIG